MRSRAVVGLLVIALALWASAPALAQNVTPAQGERRLPTPVEDVPSFVPEAMRLSSGAVVLQWQPQPAAARYEVFVNPDFEARPLWAPVAGEVVRDASSGNFSFTVDAPPAPEAGRQTVTFAVLALDAEGQPVAQGRVAVRLRGETGAFPTPAWSQDGERAPLAGSESPGQEALPEAGIMNPVPLALLALVLVVLGVTLARLVRRS